MGNPIIQKTHQPCTNEFVEHFDKSSSQIISFK